MTQWKKNTKADFLKKNKVAILETFRLNRTNWYRLQPFYFLTNIKSLRFNFLLNVIKILTNLKLINIWFLFDFFFYLSDCGDLSEIQTEDSGRPTVRVKEITPSNQTSVLSNEMARAFKPYPDRSAVQVGTRAIWIACAHCLLDSLLFRRTWFWGRCWRKTKDPFQ